MRGGRTPQPGSPFPAPSSSVLDAQLSLALFCFSPPMLTSILFFQVYEVSPMLSSPPHAVPGQGPCSILRDGAHNTTHSIHPTGTNPQHGPSQAVCTLAASFNVKAKISTHMEGLNCPRRP